MDQWKDFSARHGHCLTHYLEILAEAERLRRARAVLASQPRKAPFFAPMLAALGRRLVTWGARLHARYGERAAEGADADMLGPRRRNGSFRAR